MSRSGITTTPAEDARYPGRGTGMVTVSDQLQPNFRGQEVYRPLPGGRPPDDQLRVRDKDTVDERFQDAVVVLINETRKYSETSVGSWQERLAPHMYFPSMVIEVRSTIIPANLMEFAPEETAPNYKTFTQQSFTIGMQRYDIGMYAIQDYYNTTEGKAVWNMMLDSLGDDVLRTMHHITALNVLLVPAILALKWQQMGLPVRNPQDAFRDEFDMAFAGHESKGLGKLLYLIRTRAARVLDEPPNFDMAVVAEGAMDAIDYGPTGEWTKSPQEAPMDIVRARLAGRRIAARQMGSVDVYEHKGVIVHNQSLEEMQIFLRVWTGGSTHFIRHDAMGPPRRDGTVRAESKVYDFDTDTMATLRYRDLIGACMRFDPRTGFLLPHHQDLVESVARSPMLFGRNLSGQPVDPYIFRSSRGGGVGTGGYQIAVCQTWGDVEREFRPTDVDVMFGKVFQMNAEKEMMSMGQMKDANMWRDIAAIPDMLDYLNTINVGPDVLNAAISNAADTVVLTHTTGMPAVEVVYPDGHGADKPYGYASIAGLMQLSAQRKDGDVPTIAGRFEEYASSGYAPSSTFHKSMDLFYTKMAAMFPHSTLNSADHVPFFLQTGVPQRDAMLAYLTAVLSPAPIVAYAGDKDVVSVPDAALGRVVQFGFDTNQAQTLARINPTLLERLGGIGTTVAAFGAATEGFNALRSSGALTYADGSTIPAELALAAFMGTYDLAGNERNPIGDCFAEGEVTAAAGATPRSMDKVAGIAAVKAHVISTFMRAGRTGHWGEAVGDNFSESALAPVFAIGRERYERGGYGGRAPASGRTTSRVSRLVFDPKTLAADSGIFVAAPSNPTHALPASEVAAILRSSHMTDVSNYTFMMPGMTAGLQRGAVDCKSVFTRTNLIDRIVRATTLLKNMPVALAATISMLMSKINAHDLVRWSDEGLPGMAGNMIFCRPFIRMNTNCMVLAQGGADTAFLGWNNSSSGEQEDIVLYRRMMALRTWMNCFIKRPHNIVVIPDFTAAGVRGGLDMRIYVRRDQFRPEAAGEFSLDDPEASAFVFNVGHYERDDFLRYNDPLPLFGSYDAAAIHANTSQARGMFEKQGQKWPGSVYYNMMWNFKAVNGGNSAPRADTPYQHLRDTDYIKGICPHSIVMEFNQSTGMWEERTEERGSFPQRPGVKEALEGRTHFKMAVGEVRHVAS